MGNAGGTIILKLRRSAARLLLGNTKSLLAASGYISRARVHARASVCVRKAGWKATAIGCDWLAQWITANERIAFQNEGERQVSTEDRSVGQHDSHNGRRTNCNDDRRSLRIDNSADSQIGSKQNNELRCKWTVKSRCLLKIEVLNTMIDEVQIDSEGENELRLGVIYEQISSKRNGTDYTAKWRWKESVYLCWVLKHWTRWFRRSVTYKLCWLSKHNATGSFSWLSACSWEKIKYVSVWFIRKVDQNKKNGLHYKRRV